MTLNPTDFLLVYRGASSYRVTSELLPDKLQAGDYMLVNRGAVSYRLSGTNFLAGDFLDSDFFLVNRGASSFKCPGSELRGSLDPNTDVVGAIAYWAAPVASMPTDWFVCDGQAISATDYPVLATLLGEAGGQISLPNLATGEYLAHTSNDASIGTTSASSLKAAGITASIPTPLTFSCGNTSGGWSGGVQSNNDSHSHYSGDGSSWNSGDTGDSMGATKPHTTWTGAWTHRPNAGNHTANPFEYFKDSHQHTHPTTQSLNFGDNGSHGHSWSTTININHNHPGGTGLSTTKATGTSTTVELNAVVLVPIMYAGAKGYDG